MGCRVTECQKEAEKIPNKTQVHEIDCGESGASDAEVNEVKKLPPFKIPFTVMGADVEAFLDPGIYEHEYHGFIQKRLYERLKPETVLDRLSKAAGTTGHTVVTGPVVRVQLHPDLPPC